MQAIKSFQGLDSDCYILMCDNWDDYYLVTVYDRTILKSAKPTMRPCTKYEYNKLHREMLNDIANAS